MITVASLLQIMDYVGSLDSSRDLQPIHAKSFVNRFHLILQISKISTIKFYARTKEGLTPLALDQLSPNPPRSEG